MLMLSKDFRLGAFGYFLMTIGGLIFSKDFMCVCVLGVRGLEASFLRHSPAVSWYYFESLLVI